MSYRVVVSEDVVDIHRRIRKQQERIERYSRGGLDASTLKAELRTLEEGLLHLMHHREVLARSVA